MTLKISGSNQVTVYELVGHTKYRYSCVCLSATLDYSPCRDVTFANFILLSLYFPLFCTGFLSLNKWMGRDASFIIH